MTRTDIINAAFIVWGRNLYKKTSLSELAKELGVSKSALYRHFESKETLYDEMAKSFLDDFASSVRDDFQRALQIEDADKGISIIISSIADYFARNMYALIFSLVNIYDRNLDEHMINAHLKKRRADMKTLMIVAEKKYNCNLTVIKLIFATLTFFMSHFHKTNESFENTPSEKGIKNIISTINKITQNGISGFGGAHKNFCENALSLDFKKLEKQVEKTIQCAEPEPLFKAVAEAVAEAGPWDASMEMVAKRMGLSKSSLYGHFENRTDMLRRLFKTEFTRIMEFARQAIKSRESQKTSEQLYLGIYSIAVYFRSRPEILIALGWIRTRKLDLGKPENIEIFRLFEDVKIEGLKTEEEKESVSHWILFLLINILSQPKTKVSNNDLRLLYKFITLGLGGFKR